jgi:hypothetical protein
MKIYPKKAKICKTTGMARRTDMEETLMISEDLYNEISFALGDLVRLGGVGIILCIFGGGRLLLIMMMIIMGDIELLERPKSTAIISLILLFLGMVCLNLTQYLPNPHP